MSSGAFFWIFVCKPIFHNQGNSDNFIPAYPKA